MSVLLSLLHNCFEILHSKFFYSWQELDNTLRVCKDDFKEFERQDVKYREDLKHKKQKIKKLDEKLEKVGRYSVYLHQI